MPDNDPTGTTSTDGDNHLGPVTVGGEPPRIEFPGGEYDPFVADDLAFDATEAAFEG